MVKSHLPREELARILRKNFKVKGLDDTKIDENLLDICTFLNNLHKKHPMPTTFASAYASAQSIVNDPRSDEYTLFIANDILRICDRVGPLLREPIPEIALLLDELQNRLGTLEELKVIGMEHAHNRRSVGLDKATKARQQTQGQRRQCVEEALNIASAEKPVANDSSLAHAASVILENNHNMNLKGDTIRRKYLKNWKAKQQVK